MSEPCTFCEIAARRAPAHVVDEDELSLALLDIHPFTEGHTLVISKRHVQWWHDLTDEEITSVFLMAKRVARRLGATFSPEFVCLYARGRRIPHTHVFLVPTTRGDVLDGFFNALEKFQESPQALAELKSAKALSTAAEKIRSQD
jgi:histidine triad (HIT) family protein